MKHEEDSAKGRGRKVGYGKGVYTEVWNGNLSWKLKVYTHSKPTDCLLVNSKQGWA